MIRENTEESILCVCYTNHALDQFLEHMLDHGERKVVRIGGRSRSEKIGQYNLRALARKEAAFSDATDHWRRRVDAQSYAERDNILKQLEVMETPIRWTSPHGGIRRFLQEDYPEFYNYFHVNPLSEGFHVVGPDSKELKEDHIWKCWINGDFFPAWLKPYRSELSSEFTEFWSQTLDERLATLMKWKIEILSINVSSIEYSIRHLNQLSKSRQGIQYEQEREILMEARVIGATTTGAAQHKELLCSKGAPVVIVEEAGEVLEAHILSLLDARTTKHLILIGDHQQLRPKVETYALSTVSGRGYDLDCSLFERLVLRNLPSVTLGVQHRMRPEIADLIRQQTYPALRDHPSVRLYPDVKGVTENMIFIDHSAPEGGNSDDAHAVSTRTKSNSHEAEISVEIARFLLLQGYTPDSIVILTPYVGQLLLIISLIRSRLKEATALVSDSDLRDITSIDEDLVLEPQGEKQKHVRCSSIDNYQGEEADLVVISLVRSNARGNIGFLKEPQRVNVLLSRARHGLILIGNSKTLVDGGDLVWRPIVDEFKRRALLFRGLPTYCQLHPRDAMKILTELEDFRTERPNGGCSRPCVFRMECGHACHLTCHPFDRNHQIVQKGCSGRCIRVPPDCPSGHRCRKLCRDLCRECIEEVGPTLLNCGHILPSAHCHDVRNEAAIEVLSKKCKEKVFYRFTACNHEVEIECANARSDAPVCPTQCSKIVASCGHQCSNPSCSCDGSHSCDQSCERILFCGHVCGQSCHAGRECPPCLGECHMTCTHSSCHKRCHDMCASCIEHCDWTCVHQGGCPLVCGAPCFRFPCNKRCSKLLECGHRCPSLCGENCPDKEFCQICCEPNLKEKVVDMVMFTTYEDHDVEYDPIVVLPCLHFYATSTLDGHFGIAEVYDKSAEGEFCFIRPLHECNVNEKRKTCPDCRSVVHSVRRYGRLLQLSGLRSLERKHLMLVGDALRHVEGHLEFDGKGRLEGMELITRLKAIEKMVNQSPMRRVFEACRNPKAFDVPQPPTQPLLHTLELLGNAYANMVEQQDDENEKQAKATFDRAIEIADSRGSIASSSILRLSKCELLLKWNPLTETSKTDAMELLEWVISHKSIVPEQAEQAKRLMEVTTDQRRVIAEVLSAMNQHVGYNYGGSWSSHWYECPNGHPYFIGECGGAMQQSHCIECGAPVGGTHHNLDSSNRRADGVVGDILRENS